MQHHPGGSHLVSSASGFVVAGAGYFIYHKMKDAYYFPHDSNAKDDPKMVMLIEQLGLEGYGIFWVLIETLREQPDYKYPLSLLPAIARRYNTTSEKVKTVVGNYALFSIVDDDFFLSESLIKRMLPLEERRAKNRIAGLKSAEKRQRMLNECSTRVQHALNECSTSKVKKSKEEEKEKDICDFLVEKQSETEQEGFTPKKQKNTLTPPHSAAPPLSLFKKALEMYPSVKEGSVEVLYDKFRDYCIKYGKDIETEVVAFKEGVRRYAMLYRKQRDKKAADPKYFYKETYSAKDFISLGRWTESFDDVIKDEEKRGSFNN